MSFAHPPFDQTRRAVDDSLKVGGLEGVERGVETLADHLDELRYENSRDHAAVVARLDNVLKHGKWALGLLVTGVVIPVAIAFVP